MRKGFSIIVLISAACLLTLKAQTPTDKKIDYRPLYAEANRLYDLDDPSSETDSIAVELFLLAIKHCNAPNYDVVVNSYIKAGNIRQGQQRFEEANTLYHLAISINNSHSKNDKLLYESFLYLGSSCYFNNVIDSAQIYFEKASVIEMNYKGTDKLPERDRLYNSIGAIFFESANYLQAKNYFQKALDFSDKKSEEYNEMYTGAQSNIANCLMKLHQFDSAKILLKSLKPDLQQQKIIAQNIAHCYFELKEYDSALVIYQSLPINNNYASIVALTDMGRIFMKRKQWQQAEAVFDSAINRNRNISVNIKNKEEALAYLYRSELAMQQGLPDEALTWVNDALQEVHLKFKWTKTDDLPENIAETVSPITLFTILHQKARLLYKRFETLHQENSLFSSLSTYLKAIETANFIKLNFDNDEAKLFFNETYRSIYAEAVAVAFEAFQLKKSSIDDFVFILENYKGNILYQNLQSVLSKTNGQIPDSVHQREKELKQLLAFYTSRINQSSGENDAAQLQNRLISLQVELSRLQTTYDQYANFQLDRKLSSANRLTVDSIQKAINSSTTLINYYTGEKFIYCLTISKQDAQIIRIAIDSSFNTKVKDFLTEVYQHEEGKRYEGMAASAKMYEYLIKPIEFVSEEANHWVIIPDGILYYLPFDAFVKNNKEKDYLVLTKNISYHYSFALLLEKSSKRSFYSKEKVMAYAPFARADSNLLNSNLPLLPLSEKEVMTAGKRPEMGINATKAKFLSNAKNFPVIHLATHASTGTDSTSNWIQFYPSDRVLINSRLFVEEIYPIDFHQTELVILSACETGGGISASGEGLLSLSRAFLYAGTDGIISTLWKTEDKVTAYLMQRLHHYLNDQVPVSKALQLAKRDLLQDQTIGSQFKSPNYWANFIYVGKLDILPNNQYLWLKWAFIPAILTGLFILYKKYKKKIPSNN